MGEADCLVTGDRDLLVMSPFQGIPILTPTAYLHANPPAGDSMRRAGTS